MTQVHSAALLIRDIFWYRFLRRSVMDHLWYLSMQSLDIVKSHWMLVPVQKIRLQYRNLKTGWWFGTSVLFFPIILGMSSSQLTHIFQRGRRKTTKQKTRVFRSTAILYGIVPFSAARICLRLVWMIKPFEITSMYINPKRSQLWTSKNHVPSALGSRLFHSMIHTYIYMRNHWNLWTRTVTSLYISIYIYNIYIYVYIYTYIFF